MDTDAMTDYYWENLKDILQRQLADDDEYRALIQKKIAAEIALKALIGEEALLCDLVPSASHVTDDEIRKRLEGLTPIQKKAALDLLDTYISNLPYLTNEE